MLLWLLRYQYVTITAHINVSMCQQVPPRHLPPVNSSLAR